MSDSEDVKKFLEYHTQRIKPLFKKLQLAWWNAYTTGKEDYYKEYEDFSKQLKKIHNNQEEFEKIKDWLKLGIPDQLIKRQIKVVYNDYLISQGDINLINEIIAKETEVQKKFNSFRAKVEGRELTDNQIKEILKTEKDSEKLKNAWEASKKQGSLVEKDLLDIVRMRNELAKSQGFENYYVMSLQAAEQKIEDIKSIFEELAKATDKPFKNTKSEIDSHLSNKFNMPKAELKPWHYHDLFFSAVPEMYKVNLDKFFNQDILYIAKEFYKSIGLEVEDILKKSDLYEKQGKSQHAFSIDIDKEKDVRILVNTKNDEYWMSTILHELGHATYTKYTDINLPFLIRDQAHILVTEGIAQLFGRQSMNTQFIKKYTKEKGINKFSKEITKIASMDQLVFSRWSQVMFNFEMKLYEKPEQDLNKLWWNIVKKYQFIDFCRDAPDWCAKIHFVSAPVYYHNYMLAELLASQLHKTIVEKILKQDALKNVKYSDNEEIGNYLKKNIFELGAKYEWNDLIQKATGEKLKPKYFVEEFVEYV